MRTAGSLLGGLLIGLAVLPMVAPGGQQSFKLVRQDEGQWEIECVPRERAFTTITVEGKHFIRFVEPTLTNGDDEQPGMPALPTEAFSLGIPQGASITAELENPEYQVLENANVAPHPAYDLTEEHEAVEVFERDALAYAANAFFPATQIEVQSPFTLRQQRVTTVRLRTYQYNPHTQTLRKLIRAYLRVRLRGEKTATSRSVAARDPHFEETYKTLLLNYEQAKSWRIGPSLRNFADSSAIWFETGKPYLKAEIASDGWYRLTRAEMEAAGANLSGIDLASLKLFHRGHQVTIVVRQDTTVEFYARKNYGDSSYVDYYTDTSAYWLTWGGPAGARFDTSYSSGGPTLSVLSSMQTLHVEQNRSYFAGATTSESIDNATVPGEDWYWQWFNANAQVDFNFSLDSIDRSNSVAFVRARLWGTGYSGSPPAAHIARVWINDSLAGDYAFGERQGGVFSASIPTSWLKAGTNVFRVKNIETGAPANTFYLDWFELDYSRILHATNDQLLFHSPVSPTGSVVAFAVSGFSNPQIEVHDLTSNRVITNTIVTSDSAQGFAIIFQDSISIPKTYVAVSTPTQHSVASLIQKSFTNIRQLPAGADYVIITHKNFRSQADQLATHRNSVNGVRSVVIDVDDIYDEFNYGVKNATKLKTFLLYASSNWAAPAPSYLLFMGDASVDHHRYSSNSIKKDFVPAYGFPPADNWFTCFDSAVSLIPSMYVGRIPAEDAASAQIVVNKVIAYDNYTLGEWNKKFLYITGGVTPVEQSGFNYLAESSIASYINPSPLGGTPLRVFKSTAGIVDGEYKQTLKTFFKDGVSFVAFTGHSGGRVWNVDSGPPREWENTNGRLPFIASVSCNIGGFATSTNNVMAEDFLIADNRGAIASWASSSVGFATYGSALTNYWLENAISDSVREFGKLTTNARSRLWLETGSGYITVAMVNLNPLIGDPLSSFAIPRKPDLAVASPDISFANPTPTPNDSSVTARVMLHNYGLVPPESVAISVTDIYDGKTTYLLNNAKLRQTLHRDSVLLQFPVSNKLGVHTFVVSLDPVNANAEVNELNNTASRDHTIFSNNLYIVKPLESAVVPAGVQRLVVTSPIGYDVAGFTYYFELDTIVTFDSPGRVISGPVLPAAVIGEWNTPSLPNATTYFWRCRTQHGTLNGNWRTSSFTTSDDLPFSPDDAVQLSRWRQHNQKLFSQNVMDNVSATDSGLTIVPRSPLSLYCRSVGYLYDEFRDYYAAINANEQKGSGYWWPIGASFVAARVNDFTGIMDYRAFPLYAAYGATNAGPWQADSFANFINTAPIGTYIAVATIFNGQTNVNDRLRQAMDSLGATMFRSIVSGQTYAFIGRKGNGAPGMTPLELLRTNDSSVVSLTIPSYYGAASGSVTSSEIPMAASWDSFHWRRTVDASRTNAKVAILGIRANDGVDTLRVLPADSVDVNLASLNAQTRGPRYSTLKLAGSLSTSDPTITPVLTDWWIDFSAPPDLAVSAQTVGVTQNDASAFTLPLTVHNIGYAKSDSVRALVYALDKYNLSKQVGWVLLDSIPIDGSRSTSVTFSTAGLPRKTRLQVVVSSVHKGKDLIAENNVAYYQLTLNTAIPAIQMQVFVNGSEIMDGDYIPPDPKLTVRPKAVVLANSAVQAIDLLVDNHPHERSVVSVRPTSGTDERESEFFPQLETGSHELKFKLSMANDLGELDSLEHVIHVNVERESGIRNVANYPNPFSRETYFTFVITGTEPPDEVSVRVFTIAGRKIRDILVSQSSLQLGFNRVHWDGRDSDGDEVANGYYLYQVTTHAEGGTHSAIEKLVKVK